MKKKRAKLTPAAKRKGWLKFFLFMAVLTTLIFAAGFVTFAHKVDNLRPPQNIAKADGIVVWTGKGGGRLEAGGKLLQGGHGERLLISGVNPANDGKAVQSLLGLPDDKFGCCVDLDYVAENTYGNGQETEIWASALGYETIILVTSSYHMPRAKVEIGAAHPKLNIIPYPVKGSADPARPWWGGKEWHKRALREYGKLLIAYTRDPGARTAAQNQD